MRWLTVAAVVLGVSGPWASAECWNPQTQLVVFHTPGETWPADGNIAGHPMIKAHAHYWLTQRSVHKGGPLAGTAGGMMLFRIGTSEAEARAIAEADPAVQARFLKADVRQWVLKVNADNCLRSPSTKY